MKIILQFLRLRSPSLINIIMLLNVNLKNQDQVGRFSSVQFRRTRTWQHYVHPNTLQERSPRTRPAVKGRSHSLPPPRSASLLRHQPFTGFLEPGFGFKLARLTRGRPRSRSRGLAPRPFKGPAMTRKAETIHCRLPLATWEHTWSLDSALRPRPRPCRTAAAARPSAPGRGVILALGSGFGRICKLVLWVLLALPSLSLFFFSLVLWACDHILRVCALMSGS